MTTRVHAPLASAELPVLRLQNVSFIRERVTILDSMSLTVMAGQHCAVLGPNGCGKTTLLRILTREIYPSVDNDGQVGTVEVLGRARWELAELRKQIGVVSQALDQSFSLDRTGRMTAAQAVATGLTGVQLARFSPHLEDGVLRGDVRQAVIDRLTEVGMADRIEQRLETMSTGQRRRVMIARALILNPSVLILDEPTTGLDMVARHDLLMSLADWIESTSATVFWVTHHLDEILPTIDHVVLLDRGRIMVDGNRQEALTDENLTRAFRRQVCVQWSSTGQSAIRIQDQSRPGSC
ncbi:MAG: ATP-binding cassette domain-containing protein [Planctomycetota bacterium]